MMANAPALLQLFTRSDAWPAFPASETMDRQGPIGEGGEDIFLAPPATIGPWRLNPHAFLGIIAARLLPTFYAARIICRESGFPETGASPFTKGSGQGHGVVPGAWVKAGIPTGGFIRACRRKRAVNNDTPRVSTASGGPSPTSGNNRIEPRPRGTLNPPGRRGPAGACRAVSCVPSTSTAAVRPLGQNCSGSLSWTERLDGYRLVLVTWRGRERER